MKIFILVHAGCVTDVYADSPKVDVEIIDLDDQNCEDCAREAKERADQIQAEYMRVD